MKFRYMLIGGAVAIVTIANMLGGNNSASAAHNAPTMQEALDTASGRSNCGELACTYTVKSDYQITAFGFDSPTLEHSSSIFGEFTRVSQNESQNGQREDVYQIDRPNPDYLNGKVSQLAISSKGVMWLADKDGNTLQTFTFTDSPEPTERAMNGLKLKVKKPVRELCAVDVGSLVALDSEQCGKVKRFKSGDVVRIEVREGGEYWLVNTRNGTEVYF